MSLLTVLASFVLAYLLGALWYSPLMFGKPWLALQTRDPSEMKMDAKVFALSIGAWLITALCFNYLFISLIQEQSLLSALRLAVVVWLGFSCCSEAMAVAFGGKNIRLSMIDLPYHLSGLLLIALMNAWLV